MKELFTNLLSSEMISALGLTFLHSLWIGAIGAFFLWIFLRFSPKASSSVKSSVAYAIMMLFLLSAVVTFRLQYEQNKTADFRDNGLIILNDANDFSYSAASRDNYENIISTTNSFDLNKYIRWFMLFWMAGAFIMSLRMIIDLLKLKSITSTGSLRKEPALASILNKIMISLDPGIEVNIFSTLKASIPFTAGFLKPAIYIPAGMLTAMPADQLEAIIAHELAHIKRNDFLLNFVQSLVEILFFFNPALMWISHITREEREKACDEEAIAYSGEPLPLAKALVSIADFNSALPAAAMSSGKDTKQIYRRLNKMKENKTTQHSRGIPAGLFVLSASILLLLFTLAAAPPLMEKSAESKTFTQDDEREKITLYDTIDGKEVKWHVVMEDGKIIELYRNDERIPDDEIESHEKYIKKKIRGLSWDFEFDELDDINIDIDIPDVDIDFDFDDLGENMVVHIDHDGEHDIHINLNGLDEKLEKFAKNWEKYGEKWEKFGEKMANFHVKMGDFEVKMDKLEAKLEKLEDFLDEVKEELVDDGFIEDEDDHFSLRLNADEMTVNGKEVPADLHNKYKEIYKKHFDKEIGEKGIKIR